MKGVQLAGKMDEARTDSPRRLPHPPSCHGTPRIGGGVRPSPRELRDARLGHASKLRPSAADARTVRRIRGVLSQAGPKTRSAASICPPSAHASSPSTPSDGAPGPGLHCRSETGPR